MIDSWYLMLVPDPLYSITSKHFAGTGTEAAIVHVRGDFSVIHGNRKLPDRLYGIFSMANSVTPFSRFGQVDGFRASAPVA